MYLYCNEYRIILELYFCFEIIYCMLIVFYLYLREMLIVRWFEILKGIFSEVLYGSEDW